MNIFQEYALKFVGLPYKWGGDDPMAGFDCSGFALEMLRAFGAKELPRHDMTAHMIWAWCLREGVSSGPGCGSLAFYGGPEKITHIAVMISSKLIVEFGGGGSRTNTVQDAINQNAYGRIRPVSFRSDLVDILTPAYEVPFNGGNPYGAKANH